MAEKKLDVDSPADEKLAAIKAAAKYFNSDLTQLICRDAAGNLQSVHVFAQGKYAVMLERWLGKLDRVKRERPRAG